MLDEELNRPESFSSVRRSRQQMQPVVDVAKVKTLTGQITEIEREKDKI